MAYQADWVLRMKSPESAGQQCSHSDDCTAAWHDASPLTCAGPAQGAARGLYGEGLGAVHRHVAAAAVLAVSPVPRARMELQ